MPTKKKTQAKNYFSEDNFWLKFLIAILALCLINYIIVLTDNVSKSTKYIGVGQKTETEDTISVQGTGEVYAKPDLAVVNFSVKNEAKTANEAMETNVQKMNSVINVLKSAGVAEEDMKTISFEVYPYYKEKEGESKILIGYEVEQTLEVKIREINKAGSLVEEAARAGANQVGNLTLAIEDDQVYKQEARRIAIAQAKSRAVGLSQQLGVKLAGLKSFNENIFFPNDFRPYYTALEKSASPNIEIGENKVEVTVNLIYQITN